VRAGAAWPGAGRGARGRAAASATGSGVVQAGGDHPAGHPVQGGDLMQGQPGLVQQGDVRRRDSAQHAGRVHRCRHAPGGHVVADRAVADPVLAGQPGEAGGARAHGGRLFSWLDDRMPRTARASVRRAHGNRGRDLRTAHLPRTIPRRNAMTDHPELVAWHGRSSTPTSISCLARQTTRCPLRFARVVRARELPRVLLGARSTDEALAQHRDPIASDHRDLQLERATQRCRRGVHQRPSRSSGRIWPGNPWRHHARDFGITFGLAADSKIVVGDK
jgi:hypothetical protein